MGPNKHTDAQSIHIEEPMRKVLSQLDQPLDDMDTVLIDKLLDSVQGIPDADTAYKQIMCNAATMDRRNKIRAARRRMAKRVTVLAAGLLIVAAGTLGVGNAFQWKSFLRIFSVQNGILSFQTHAEKDGKTISMEANQDSKPSLGDETADNSGYVFTSIGSAKELLSISTAGDKAFKPLLDKYAFQSGSLNRTETDDMLNLVFKDVTGNDLNIQISTVNKEYINHASSSVFFAIDEGSQKNVQIGNDTVITCTSLDVHTVQWITQYGYCHLWSKASHDELLNIAEILLNAGLKPV